MKLPLGTSTSMTMWITLLYLVVWMANLTLLCSRTLKLVEVTFSMNSITCTQLRKKHQLRLLEHPKWKDIQMNSTFNLVMSEEIYTSWEVKEQITPATSSSLRYKLMRLQLKIRIYNSDPSKWKLKSGRLARTRKVKTMHRWSMWLQVQKIRSARCSSLMNIKTIN